MKIVSLLLLAVAFFYVSCTPYKKVPYFQDLPQDSIVTEQINNFSPLVLQPGDLLGINVSSLNHEADLIYNYNLMRQPNNTTSLDQTEQTNVVGYVIDADGNIKMPTIGKIKVAGLTTQDAATLLETKLQVYLSQPTVNVRLLNFKISVLGDVKTPGHFNIQNEKITLTDALSLAGDLNTTGKRTNILLVRETNGKREYIRMDLTSKNTFDSPYFYLKNNDVIYVQPRRTKISADDGSLQVVSAVIGVLSLVTYIILRK